jgi:hypothetical protein
MAETPATTERTAAAAARLFLLQRIIYRLTNEFCMKTCGGRILKRQIRVNEPLLQWPTTRNMGLVFVYMIRPTSSSVLMPIQAAGRATLRPPCIVIGPS